MYNPFSLEGRTVLVTGASSGIGRGIALACAKAGAVLVISGRNEERLEETFSSLEGDGHKRIVADLSQQDGIERLIVEMPEVDGFVYSAGVLKISPAQAVKRNLLEETLNVNACAPILLTSALVKSKKIKKGASIVFVSSLSGVFIGGVGESAYSASKGALSGFMKTAALELATKQIRVNTVCPALVPTNLSVQYHDVVPEDELKAEIATKYPLKRMGTVDDVANSVMFLLSDASSWITGVDLVLDGGLVLK